MALELKQNLKLTQQLVMTPQLQQAIKLLQLSRLELVEEINQELEENPVLEISQIDDEPDDDSRRSNSDEEVANNREEFTQVEVKEKMRDEIDWENYLGEYSSSPSMPNMSEAPVEAASFENFISAKTTLTEHLTWQLGLIDLTPIQQRLGIIIVGNLNSDGYLKADIEEIAESESVSLEEVEQVLRRIQELDPIGIAARDLKECLLLQLRYLEQGDSLAAKMVENHLPELEVKNYTKISRQLKVPVEAVFAAERVILSLEPRPGRQYGGEDTQYVSPDVHVIKVGDEYVIVLNEDGLPRLKVSQYYRDMITNVGDNVYQAKDYIQGKLRAAQWLIRSIHQRQRTIYRVTESIFKFQREFLDRGVEYLKPLVLRDVADDVGLHESTISRVTTNKYVHTPQGLFELKFFFDSPINRFHGESLASESVKKRIKQIIGAEDPMKPLSDQRIVEILKGADIDIARRTVAKYREMMGISSSNKRKKYY